MQSTIQLIRNSLSEMYSNTEIDCITRILFEEVCHFSSSDFILCKNTILSASYTDKIKSILIRLQKYEPLQYILGSTFFYGYRFIVTPDVLIPRPETEELVKYIIDENKTSHGHILDLGTGSGCIPISLALNLPSFTTEGWDISEKAIEIASKNGVNLNAETRFTVRDIFGKYPDMPKADIIVSNPPYICEMEKSEMEENVLDYEPHTALFVPNDIPLLFYDRIAEMGNEVLSEKGKIYFEINASYGSETAQMLRNRGYESIRIIKDINNKDRFVSAIKK